MLRCTLCHLVNPVFFCVVEGNLGTESDCVVNVMLRCTCTLCRLVNLGLFCVVEGNELDRVVNLLFLCCRRESGHGIGLCCKSYVALYIMSSCKSGSFLCCRREPGHGV